MSTEKMSNRYDFETRDMELLKLKNQLYQFVIKMKSEGYLSSVDYNDSIGMLDIDNQIEN